jgi:hypothetical protein
LLRASASTQLASEYTNAVQIANNLIAQTSMENPLQRSETSGIENNVYHWQRLIRATPLFICQNSTFSIVAAYPAIPHPY